MNQEYDIKYDFYPIQCMNTMLTSNLSGTDFHQDNTPHLASQQRTMNLPLAPAPAVICTANYIGKLNQPNIVLAKTNTPYVTYYTTTSLKVTGPANKELPPHNGQIVLELKPSTSDKNLIVTFLLKYENVTDPKRNVSGSSNVFPIQQLLNQENPKIAFNDFLDSESMQIDAPKNENIIYLTFMKPIGIQQHLNNTATKKCSCKQPVSTTHKEGFTEGYQDMTCELLDVPQDEIVSVLQVPTDSLGYNDLVSKGYGDVFLNQLMVLFVAIFTFLLGPFLYVWFRNLVGELLVNKEELTGPGKILFTPVTEDGSSFHFLKAFDFFGDKPALWEFIHFAVIFLIVVISLAVGFGVPNLAAKVTGVFTLFLYIFLYFGIKFYYSSRPELQKCMRAEEGKKPYPLDKCTKPN